MVNYLNFHPKEDCMATCSKDMTIKLWKRKHGDEFKVYKTLAGHDHEVSAVEYLRPNGEYLISCSRDKTIRIWDTTSGFLM
jgi:platelet-activating factor acetylhydrolase IB subunit alpha